MASSTKQLNGTCNQIETSVPVQTDTSSAPGFGLGSKTWGISATRESTPIKPPLPSDLHFTAAASAGTVTFKFLVHDDDLDDGDRSYSSPDDTLVVAAATSTQKQTSVVPVTAVGKAVSIQGVSGGSGATISFYHACFKAPLPTGKGNRQAQEGWNCLPPAGGNNSYTPSA